MNYRKCTLRKLFIHRRDETWIDLLLPELIAVQGAEFSSLESGTWKVIAVHPEIFDGHEVKHLLTKRPTGANPL